MLKHEKSPAVLSWTRGHLGSFINGQPSIVLENVSKILSAKISDQAIKVMKVLQTQGFELYIVSCSTDSLLKSSLYFKGADTLFRGIVGNHVSSYSGQIMDYTCNFRSGKDKVAFLEQTMKLSPENTIVIGASQDDIPLLEWSRYPILVDASREGWKKYDDKHFIFMESIQMVPEIIKSLV
jgi:phosphoserine phosphatase